MELRRIGQPGYAQEDDGQLRQAGAAGSRTLEDFIDRKTLTGNERQNLERIKQTWRWRCPAAALGKDLERELIDYMEQNQGSFTGAVVWRNPTPSRRCSPRRVRREPAGRRPLRRRLLRGHQQPERSGAGTGRACAGGHSGLCLGRSGAARRPQPATSSLPKVRPPHRARGTVSGTTRSTPPSMRATKRDCLQLLDAADRARSGLTVRSCFSARGFPDATEEPRHRGGSAIAGRLAVGDEHAWSPAAANAST